MSTHEELRDLIAIYAIDALDGEERMRVESHIDVCDECRAEVDDFRTVVTNLDDPDSPAPPDRVWDSIATAIATTDADQTADVIDLRNRNEKRSSVRQSRIGRTNRIAAIAAVVAGLVVGTALLTGDDSPTTAREVAVAAVSDAEVVHTLVDESGQPVARAAVSDDGAWLVLDGLPDPGEEDYQLWAVTPEVISVGLVDGDGVLRFQLDPNATTLVLTREPAGGSVVARGPAVAQVEVTSA